jgi:GTP-binding protein EngB required for normal cell division
VKFGRAADLPERLEALAAAAVLAEGRLDSFAVAAASNIISKSNERLRHGTAHTLVALLGATGSGKSSIANALVGSEVATTGLRRPTTSSTLACVWGDDDAQPLLDWLEVANRHQVSGDDAMSGLVLLDVPDHDSVQVEHRMEMEWIAAHADMLLWITDPQKYADAALHRYLRDLSGHGAVMVVALNKVDTLRPSEVKACREDLSRLLANDGIASAKVVEMSMVTGEGVPELRKALAKTIDDQKIMVGRLMADVSLAAGGLKDSLGPDTKPGAVRAKDLSSELVDASGIRVVAQAVEAGHLRDASAATGWPVTRWVRKLRPHPLRRLHLAAGSGGRSSLPEPSGAQRARVSAAVRNAADAATEGLPAPWPSLVRKAAVPDSAALQARIDDAVGDATRKHHQRNPMWWKLIGLIQMLVLVATLVGLGWLGIIFLAQWFQLPDLPTPEVRSVPVPTALALGGLLLGWLLGLISRQFARVGAKRRSRAVRTEASKAVASLADELILDPIRTELESRSQLHELLKTASGE